MTANPHILKERKTPAYSDAVIFRGKTILLQLRRALVDLSRKSVEGHSKGDELIDRPVVATSRTLLWSENDPAERFLVAGKIHNLRLAVRKLDGLEVPAGSTFSFWKQVGRTSRLKGFVSGRELREGCIIPNTGGGLCQLSNALYDAALQANCEIVERHAHTQVVAGSLAEKGRDATVFWNYVDLRFRSRKAFRIEARLDSENLVVQFRGDKSVEKPMHKIKRAVIHTDGPNSCSTCENGDCHRVVDKQIYSEFGRTGYLVDELSPEFDKYVSANRSEHDLLLIPLDGARFRKGNYAWSTSGFGRVHQSVLVTAKRSYRSRKLAAQGAARQMNLLRMYEELAESYAARLSYDVLHVVVQQNLLPYLWKNGHLGGRTFDVLMSSLPMFAIHERLDLARAVNSGSKTLGDFRASADLIAAERDALAKAGKIITSHTEIASLYPQRTDLVEWEKPSVAPRTKRENDKPVIVFPASTVARKGCYELRDALRGLDVRLLLLGPLIEGADFWNGFDIERGPADWLERADLVVLPAHVEHRPRRLLLAAAAGVPVLASSACGVSNVDGIKKIERLNAENLREAIVSVLKTNAAPAPVSALSGYDLPQNPEFCQSR